jgi:hypothetical protein
MQVVVKKLSINTCSNICILPKDVYKALNLDAEITYTFHFGLSMATPVLKCSESNDKVMYTSYDLFDKLNLLQNSTINIWRKGSDIHLGPVVGIFTSKNHVMIMSEKSINRNAREHINAGRSEGCICYYFYASSIDWARKRVKGFAYMPEIKKCGFSWFPLPEVLYDKVPAGRSKKYPVITETRRKLKNTPGIKPINSLNVLGKLETYEALVKYDESKKYLPETIIYSSFDDVTRMLDKNDLIFLKSYYGGGGSEVLSIEQIHNKYKFNYYDNGPHEIILDKINEVKKLVTKYVGTKKFIVQQGIRLLPYKGCNMDVRLFVMKNELGKWETIFKGARVTKKDFKITNNHAGGVYAIYEQIYHGLVKEHGSINIPSPEKLSLTATKLAACLELEMGAFGEIGLDLGIDTKGNIWLIEANSKPDKVIRGIRDINGKPLLELISKYYTGSMKNNKILPHALAIFKYAKFLAGVNKT